MPLAAVGEVTLEMLNVPPRGLSQTASILATGTDSGVFSCGAMAKAPATGGSLLVTTTLKVQMLVPAELVAVLVTTLVPTGKM